MPDTRKLASGRLLACEHLICCHCSSIPADDASLKCWPVVGHPIGMSALEEGVPVAQCACTFHPASYCPRCAENGYALHDGQKPGPEATPCAVLGLQVDPCAVDVHLRPTDEVVDQRRPVVAKVRRNTQPLAAHLVLRRLQHLEQRSSCSAVGLKRAGGGQGWSGEMVQTEDTFL